MNIKTSQIWGVSPKKDFYAPARWLLILLLAGSFFSPVKAQQQQPYNLEDPITLNLAHTTVTDVLEAVGKQTNYSFIFAKAEFKKIEVDKVEWNHVPLRVALNDLKKKQHINFMVVNSTISFQTELPGPPKKDTIIKKHVTLHVADDKTGSPVEGANVSVQDEGKVVVTDKAGNVTLPVQDSSAVLIISMVGYGTRTIKVGDHTLLSIRMREDRKFLSTATVQGRLRRNNEVALLNERRNAAVISDGISARDIDKTASITTVQALQRITGVTTTDDKYVAIRGLGDRNVVVQMNGARLSSADPDHNSVAIDIIPAGFLDNVNVYKTITPDKPADAVAGIVELRTKSIPDTFTVNITCQYGTNSNIGLGGTYTSFSNADLGFFGQKVTSKDLSPGFQALSTEFPGGTPQLKTYMQSSLLTSETYQEGQRINNMMHSLDPNLITNRRRAGIDQTYGITVGNRYTVFHHHELGIVLGFNYYHRFEELPNSQFTQWSIYKGQNALPSNFTVGGTPGFYFVNGNGDKSTGLSIPNYITPDNIVLGKFLSYNENNGKEIVNYGGMASLGYRFNERHVIKFSYVLNRGSEAIGDNQSGSYSNSDFINPILQSTYMLRQTHKTLNIWQSEGEHSFHIRKFAPKLTWMGSTSYATQDDPDYRYVNLITNYNNALAVGNSNSFLNNYVTNPINYVLGSQGVISDLFGDTTSKYYANANSRMFRYLTERNYNATVDLQLPFHLAGQEQLFKAGGFYLDRERHQQENILYLPQLPSLTVAQSYLGALPTTDPFASLFGNSPANPNQLISPDKIGFQVTTPTSESSYMPVGFLYNVSKSPGNYQGTMRTGAFYGMLDLHPIHALRLVGGVRFELSHIKGSADTIGAKDISLIGAAPAQNFLYTPRPVDYNTKWKPYPSATVIYSLHENMKFRLAYSKTFARPELREILPIVEFDPVQQAMLLGNPSLVNQIINAADFRWEWFPAPGEVFAASVFGKLIDHQISKSFLIDSAGLSSTTIQFPVIHYENDSNQGKVYGIELEARKHLGSLWQPLNHFFIGGNLMLAASVVNKNPGRLLASRIINRHAPTTSPLFEQPPYSVNLILDYDNPVWGTNCTLSFNEVGERLVQVQLTGEPDIYTRPQAMLNFVFGQEVRKFFGRPLGRRLLIKGYVKNLLNSPYEEVYTIPGNSGKYFGQTYTHRIYHQGLQFSLGGSLDLF